MDPVLESHIRRAARSGALPHSVIFSGSGDLLEAARFYAAALECREQDKPCLRCPACGKVLRGTHPRLTVQDQNVLLKLVEEGPRYAAFLFCAENPAVLLPTVRSRCAEFSVRPAEREEAPLAPEALTLLEALAGGEGPEVVRVLVGLENGKITREKLQDVLRSSREGAQQALRLRCGAPPQVLCADCVGPLSRKLNKKQLMQLCEMLGRFAQECEWNVAVGQVLGALAAEWEDIL